MEFINDASLQTGGSLLSYNTFYTTKVKPTIKLNSNSGLYNPSNNVIKLFTNNNDALTIDENQQLSGNATGLTNLNYNAIANKPDLTIYATDTNLNNLSSTVSGHTSSINDNTTAININNTSINHISTSINNLDESINNLNSTSSSLLGLINGNTTQITNLNTTSTSLLGLIMIIQHK